jgi:hypothetical protein
MFQERQNMNRGTPAGGFITYTPFYPDTAQWADSINVPSRKKQILTGPMSNKPSHHVTWPNIFTEVLLCTPIRLRTQIVRPPLPLAHSPQSSGSASHDSHDIRLLNRSELLSMPLTSSHKKTQTESYNRLRHNCRLQTSEVVRRAQKTRGSNPTLRI